MLLSRAGFCQSLAFAQKRTVVLPVGCITPATSNAPVKSVHCKTEPCNSLEGCKHVQSTVVQDYRNQPVRPAVHLQAHVVRPVGTAAGLYGIVGLESPHSWYDAAEKAQEDIQDAMRQLQSHLHSFDESQMPDLAHAANERHELHHLKRSALACLLSAVNTADSLLLPAQHCAAHHPDVSWREASSQVVQVATDMQQQLQQITQQLSQHPLLQEHAQDLETCTRLPQHSILGMIAGTDNAPVNTTSENSFARSQPDQEDIQVFLDLVTELQGVADFILSPSSGHSVLLLHVHDAQPSNLEPGNNTVDVDFLRRLPSLRQYVEDRKIRGYHMPQMPNHDGSELQQLWAADADLNQLMSDLATPGNAGSTSGDRGFSRSFQGSDHHVKGLEPYKHPRSASRSRSADNVMELPAELGTVDLGPSVWLTQATQTAVHDGKTSNEDDIRVLDLSLPTCLALLAGHPSSTLRYYLYQAGLMPRLKAFFAVVDGLRQVRQALAHVQGSESWAHLHLQSYSAGCPEAAVSVLEDITAAWTGPATDQQQQFLHVLSQQGDTTTAGHDGLARIAGRPCDLDYCMHAMLGASRLPQWQRFMSRFPVHHVVSTGLSRVMEPAGLRLQLLPCNPEQEFWSINTSTSTWNSSVRSQQGSQAILDPIKVLISDVAADRVNSKGNGSGNVVPLGVVNVIPDPNAALPFTCVVRPASHVNDISSQTSTHTSDEHLIHVAVHIPAAQLVPLAHNSNLGDTVQDAQTYGVAEPSMLRLLLHEMGHAVSYVLTGFNRPTCRSCASFASAEVAELSSHVIEKLACDPGSLVLLSSAANPSQQLSPAESRGLATLMAAPLTSYSPTELQQQSLLALADVVLHAPGCHSMTTEEVIESVWRSYSAVKEPAFTQRLISLLPGLIHLSGGVLSAYPTAELVAAALWHHLDLEFKIAGPGASIAARRSGWRLVREKVLSASADVSLTDVMVSVFDKNSMMRHPAEPGSMVLNLASPIFQNMSL